MEWILRSNDEPLQIRVCLRTEIFKSTSILIRAMNVKGRVSTTRPLKVTFNGKTITYMLYMPNEDGVELFGGQAGIGRNVRVFNELSLRCLTLGQSATTISGGEA